MPLPPDCLLETAFSSCHPADIENGTTLIDYVIIAVKIQTDVMSSVAFLIGDCCFRSVT